jgi:hypothetical protein
LYVQILTVSNKAEDKMDTSSHVTDVATNVGEICALSYLNDLWSNDEQIPPTKAKFNNKRQRLSSTTRGRRQIHLCLASTVLSLPFASHLLQQKLHLQSYLPRGERGAAARQAATSPLLLRRQVVRRWRAADSLPHPTGAPSVGRIRAPPAMKAKQGRNIARIGGGRRGEGQGGGAGGARPCWPAAAAGPLLRARAVGHRLAGGVELLQVSTEKSHGQLCLFLSATLQRRG